MVAFPPLFIFASSSGFHASMVMDRTKEMCTPSPRCLPEHSRQRKMPWLTLAHCGFTCVQSAHTLFSRSANKSRKTERSDADAIVLIWIRAPSRGTAGDKTRLGWAQQCELRLPGDTCVFSHQGAEGALVMAPTHWFLGSVVDLPTGAGSVSWGSGCQGDPS